jgi:hypothetical protein
MAERRGTKMSKIYDASGARMNLQQICGELVDTMTSEQKELLRNSIKKYDTFKNSQMQLAHGILDSYRLIDCTNEKGMRVRKLLDNLMNKYQKSSPATAEDQAVYHNFIISLEA